MLTEPGAELLSALKRAFPSWECVCSDGGMELRSPRSGQYRPPRRTPSWQQLLTTMESSCKEHGVARGDVLPLRGLSDADLTFSAVQALDPYLKRRHLHTYSSGFIPQPVVRLTGRRADDGTLQSGFLTSFVNVSIVQPIKTVDEHVALVDSWIAVLSAIGLHARYLTIAGTLRTWTRREVGGITLRLVHGEMILGDAVLLWNTADPAFLASDIGSGLERIRWAVIRDEWTEVVYGRPLCATATAGTLDALRTATLIVGSGIAPAHRGPGSVARRLLRASATAVGTLGLSRVVRWAHDYWSLVCPLRLPWSEVCRIIETETYRRPL